MFNDNVTIFNKYTESGVEKWQRTVLIGVYWNDVKGALIRKTGVTSADSAVIIIPRSVNAGKSYMEPKAWAALLDKTGHWTMQPGDVIVKGYVNADIVKSTKELDGYDHKLTLTNIDDKPFGGIMAHWEVGAK